MNKYFSNQKGISIFIAVFMTGLISLVVLGLNKVIVPFLRGVGNTETVNQAYFAAEAGIEDGLYDFSEHLSGYEETKKTQITLANGKKIDSEWKIQSRTAKTLDGKYTIPSPLSGNSPYDKAWNTIKLNESILIEFFIDDSQKGESPDILNPTQLILNKFYVKVRTPTSYNIQNIEDDVVLTWTIFGQSKADHTEKYSLQENPVYKNTIPITRDPDKNTEIHKSKLDCVINNKIIDSSQPFQWACGSISEGIRENGLNQSIIEFLKEVGKPSLKLSLVSNLIDATTLETIPFLEYQITVDSTLPISSETVKIAGIGDANGFIQELQTSIQKKATSSFIDFTIFQ